MEFQFFAYLKNKFLVRYTWNPQNILRCLVTKDFNYIFLTFGRDKLLPRRTGPHFTHVSDDSVDLTVRRLGLV